ncbi:hypothetical protein THAOC_06722 [Thalassiosira oceanica]|uniref:Uncharacterized protein n=1 Tax=Thalassiosira oceanica TaxID=159749 RepID=K0TLE7_THAOC|nr:hypothetical protein THAOC_06722 [Thalassiosira oceanica]|eukprot:EJK71802.1 hypothetical protein THAOC_06722 [Thalassiosira oceanica]
MPPDLRYVLALWSNRCQKTVGSAQNCLRHRELGKAQLSKGRWRLPAARHKGRDNADTIPMGCHARSRKTAHASTVTKVPTKTKKNEQNHGAPRARRIAPQPRASVLWRLATLKVDL